MRRYHTAYFVAYQAKSHPPSLCSLIICRSLFIWVCLTSDMADVEAGVRSRDWGL